MLEDKLSTENTKTKMTHSTLTPNPTFSADSEVWESLKQAIATCSGFQQWQDDQLEEPSTDTLDHQVRDYLRDTLDTLAY